MEDERLIKEYLEEVKRIADSVSVQDINKAVVLIYKAWVKNKTVYLCGNGGSASTASHFACDLSKLGVKVHCLNDNPALITAITNDNGFDNLYVEQLKNSIAKDDILICLSVHGGVGQDKATLWSQNLIKAINYAKRRGGKVVGFAGYDGGLFKTLCDASIIVGKSTPQTESWHLHIEHLMCLILREYQPIKLCSECKKVYNIENLECACGCNNYELVGGIVGNIEELKKG